MASRPKKTMAKARLRRPDPDPARQEKRRLMREVQRQREIRRLARALVAATDEANRELRALGLWLAMLDRARVPEDESLEAAHS